MDEKIQLSHYSAKEKMAAAEKPRLSFLLYNVLRPDNIASISRLADALCVKDIYLSADTFGVVCDKRDKITKSARVGDINYILVDDYDALAEKFDGCVICVEITKNSIAIETLDNVSRLNTLIVVGSEANGIDEWVLSRFARHVHVNMYGNNSSMNVGMALAICAYRIAFLQMRKAS